MKSVRFVCAALLCAGSFAVGTYGQRTVTHTEFIYIDTPVCAPISSQKPAKYFGAKIDMSATIPASALREVR